MLQKAFTLIELIVVIAIIAVLGAVVAPNAFKAIEKAKVAATISDCKAVKTATMAYYMDTGLWPNDGVTTSGLVINDGRGNWDGPYLEKWPQGRWGTAVYTFQNNATQDWNGTAPGDSARYVQLMPITLTTFNGIDRAVDGTVSATAGIVRYDAPTSAVRFLVSTDVSVN